jgi:hypothetical protein
MASISILNKVYKSVKPNTFIQATKYTDFIVGGISKFYVEHTLLKCEMMMYESILIPSNIYTDKWIMISFIFTALGTFTIYYIPAYRTCCAIVDKNLKIINVDKFL